MDMSQSQNVPLPVKKGRLGVIGNFWHGLNKVRGKANLVCGFFSIALTVVKGV